MGKVNERVLVPAPAAHAPGHLIRRRRLFERLERDWPKPLTLVTAPPGFGKTTAIETWLGGRTEPVIWVALGEDDNDPVLLWSRILAESVRAHGIGGAARTALEGTLGSPRKAIELFAAELRGAGLEPVLVLDDLHLIDDPACLRTLELGARLTAPTARLVLIGRNEPALPLDRLFARGQLIPIGVHELSFDREETRGLLRRYGVALDEVALDSVFAVTGGWPAAVYMTALWLRDAPEPSAAAREMAHPREELTAYLLSEVIGALDPEVRTFMRRTSVLPRMSGDLCDHVLERCGSTAMIELLHETNLLVRSDRRRRGWHRYHPLLRSVLRQHLDDEEPGAAAVLHGRAAEWFIVHGMPEEAAEQAREAGDHELLADLLQDQHLDLLRTGRSATLLRWAKALPDEILDARADVTMPAALIALNAGRPSVEIRRLLARAEVSRDRDGHRWSAENEVEWQMLRAGTGEDGVAVSLAAARAAAAVDAPQLTHVSKAVLSMFLEFAGDSAEARKVARETLEEPGVEARPFALLLAAGTLALVELAGGRARIAREHVDQALAVIGRAGIEDGPISARIYSCEALVCIAEGELAAAARAAAVSLRQPFDTAPLLAWTLLVAAEARACVGDFRGAEEVLGHATELIESSPDPGRLPKHREEVAARIAASRSERTALVEEVSPAELRVLRLLGEEMTRTEIASALTVSVNTVKTHQRRLYRKLGAGDRETVVARARSHGLLE
jgi:LuxR family maltose regulon positive regulatory protein